MHAQRPAPAHVPHLREALNDRDRRPLALGPHVHRGHDRIACVPEALGFELDLVHHLIEGLEVPPDPLVAAIRVGLGRELSRYGRFELRVREFEDALHVAPVEGLDQLTKRVDVMLGHVAAKYSEARFHGRGAPLA